MSSITVRDLSHSSELDRCAMGEVRGGFKFAPDAHVNLTVNQQIAQLQDIDVNVLDNNGTIGAGFEGPTVNVNALQKATNNAYFPKFV